MGLSIIISIFNTILYLHPLIYFFKILIILFNALLSDEHPWAEAVLKGTREH